MKKLLAASLAVAAALSACGNKPVPKQDQADLQQFQRVLSSCSSRGSLATRSGRKAVLSCVVPGKNEQRFASCATAAAVKDIPSHRRRLDQDLFECWSKNR